jgi:hypothetical protein
MSNRCWRHLLLFSSADFYQNKSLWVFHVVFFLFGHHAFSQEFGGATRIYTDFNGYWTSGSGAISTTKPNDSHHLLGFTWKGAVYSTGVNDERLITEGVAIDPHLYQAFPVRNIGPKSSGTYIGLGQMVDGVDNGVSVPAPFPVPPNLASFLTSGIQGLDYGSGVANIAAGNLIFDFNGIIDAAQIGDGIPDVLVTQFAQPSSTLDRIFLADADGNLVGNELSINHMDVPTVGRWTADFYNLDGTLDGGFTKTDRDLRLWVADLSAFGINLTNYEQVRSMRYRLNGDSDPAFAAYKVGVFDILAANNDEGTTNQEEPIVIDVLSNDLPIEILNFTTLKILIGPSNGVVTIDFDTGTIQYEPEAGFFGSDQFTYEVCGDSELQCDEAIVYLEVVQIPLPVKWLDFSGFYRPDKGVDLFWGTAYEKNTSHFEIQTSTDGKDWQVLDKMEAKGFSNSKVHYQLSDSNINPGRNYYRILQHDLDGALDISKVISILIPATEKNGLKIRPNPATHQLLVEGDRNELDQMKIFNTTGQDESYRIQFRRISSQVLEVSLEKLPKGIYILKTGTTAKTFQKQ